jgi:arylsulfatase A-like enzyme
MGRPVDLHRRQREGAAQPEMSSQPNVLFIITDQQRSTALGCAGVEAVQTPHLDGLAAQGTRFTNALSNTPACSPARATLLTGKHVLSHGLVQNDISIGADHRTIGQAFRDAGYHCGYIGKLHVDGRGRGAYIPPGPRRLGFDDYWAGVECNHRYLAGYHYDEATQEPVWFDGYEPDGQTDLAVNYLDDRRDQDAPFYLTVSWGPPHCPYMDVPDWAKDMYVPEDIPLMPNAVDATVRDFTSADPATPADLTREAHDLRKRQIIAGYYAHMTAMDACVGRLLAALEQNGQADNTIVVFTSDHGDMLFSQNRGWKCKPWRESVGIPLIVRWPGHVPAGRVTNGPISLVDYFPTLASMAAVDVPDEVEGADLSAFVRGDETAAPESAFINFPCMNGQWTVPAWRGVVTRQHTYAASPDGAWLLYDDQADPFQAHNLVDDESVAATREQLESLLQSWLDRTGDDFAPPAVVAERFIPNRNDQYFVDIPPLEPVIAEGQRQRYAALGR